MYLFDHLKIVTAIMSLLSISVFLIVLLIATAESDMSKQSSSMQNFKDFITSTIREQSTKIQSLLKKIQTNAQSVLEKIENVKRDSKAKRNKLLDVLQRKIKNESPQVESPLMKPLGVDSMDAESRSFSNHYQPTNYGASGYANYGTPTYHHHSIGFDPVNIVVSMSLLSFLLQALQGLLTRTRLPTPVVEAKSLNSVEDWTKSFENKLGKDNFNMKKKYLKKYF